eukprot:425531_1
MSTLQAVKNVNKRTKLTVFGYIREQELRQSFNIPLLISYTCLVYYYVPEFITKARNDYFKVSTDKLTVTNNKEYCNSYFQTIYLNQWIHSTSKMISKWIFYINKQNESATYFGLASKDNSSMKTFTNHKPNYSVSSFGYKYSHQTVDNNVVKQAKVDTGDTITFILDLSDEKKGMIKFQVNKKETVILFDNVETGNDIKYKMCLQITAKSSSVTLKSYQESFTS